MGYSGGKLICILPPEYPIIYIFINRNQNGSRRFEIVYMLQENGKVGA